MSETTPGEGQVAVSTRLETATEPGQTCYGENTNALEAAVGGICAGLDDLSLRAHLGCSAAATSLRSECTTRSRVLRLDEAFFSPSYNRNM